MKTAKKSGKSCEACGGQNTKTHLATYPVKMDERELNVERVSVRECIDCHAINQSNASRTRKNSTLYDDVYDVLG